MRIDSRFPALVVSIFLSMSAGASAQAFPPSDWNFFKVGEILEPGSLPASDVAVADGKAYVFGGSDDNVWETSIRIFDVATETWEMSATTLPYPYVQNQRIGAAKASNGSFYMSPGNGPGGWGQHGRIIEVDFAAGISRERAHIAGGSNIWGIALAPAPAALGGVYLFGGWNGGGVSAVRHYDPVTDQVRVVTHLAPGRTVGERIVHPNGLIYLFGGNTSSPTTFRAVEVFDPVTETLRAVPNPAGFGFNTGTEGWVGSDGAIYLWNPIAPYLGLGSDTVVRFDPVTETFSDLGATPIPTGAPGAAFEDPSTADGVYFLGRVEAGAIWGVFGILTREVWKLEPTSICVDDDDDGFGDPGDASCPGGPAADCDDSTDQIFPGATEDCNGIDDNCDGLIDEGFDQDGDGLAYCFDNCPQDPNPGQEDFDLDGWGDVCDDDDDDDQVLDEDDNCPVRANTDQADLDRDGLGDNCDDDIDGDGLSNQEEADIGSDPRNPDTDGGGVPDGQDANPLDISDDLSLRGGQIFGCAAAGGRGYPWQPLLLLVLLGRWRPGRVRPSS